MPSVEVDDVFQRRAGEIAPVILHEQRRDVGRVAERDRVRRDDHVRRPPEPVILRQRSGPVCGRQELLIALALGEKPRRVMLWIALGVIPWCVLFAALASTGSRLLEHTLK